jgi:hypothetical protein
MRVSIIGIICSLVLSPPAFAQTGASPRISQDRITSAVGALLPEGVDVEVIEVRDLQVSVSGVATDTVQLSQFIRRLTDSGDFAPVKLESVSKINTSSGFTLTTTIECSAAGSGQTTTLCGTAPPKTTPVHKCMVNGTITFQGTPCPPGTGA